MLLVLAVFLSVNLLVKTVHVSWVKQLQLGSR